MTFAASKPTRAFKRRHPKPIKRAPLPGYRPKRRLPPGAGSVIAHAVENAPPPTLPASVFREITDADIGIPHDPIAQEKAERYVRAAIAHRLRQEDHARKAATMINVELPDDSLHLAHATDHAINRELRRLEAMPTPRWMRPDGEAAA